MKASLNAATPTKIFPTHPCGLAINQCKKIRTFTFEARMLLKTKGGEMENLIAPNKLKKINELSVFLGNVMIRKELSVIFGLIHRGIALPDPPVVANGVLFALSTGENPFQTGGDGPRVICSGQKLLTNQERAANTHSAVSQAEIYTSLGGSETLLGDCVEATVVESK